MGNRPGTLAFAASAILLCCSLLLLLTGCITNPSDTHLSISRDFHVGVLNNGLDSRIVFFNDLDYGPYRGSIVGLAGDEYPPANAFGDLLGVYYRHFTWTDSVLWTLMVSMWYPILLFSVWPAWCFAARTRRNEPPAKQP